MLKKLLYTAIAICIALSVYLIYNNQEADSSEGRVTIIIKDDNLVKEDTFVFEDETLLELITQNYETDIQSGFVYKIDFLEAYDVREYFIEIYINCEKSTKGINSIELNDGDEISFIYKELGDYSNVCN